MSDTFCAMQRLRFLNLSQNNGALLYQWEVRNLTNNQLLYTQSSTDPKEDLVFQFVDPGDYKIILIAIDRCGCRFQDEKTLNIREGTGITVECPSVVCSDSLREVSYIAEDSCTNYHWLVVGGILTYQNHNMIRVKWTESPPSAFGYIKLTTTGCSGDLCEGITIIEVPILNAYAEIKGQTYICEKTGTFAYSVPSWPGASYQWSLSPTGMSELQILSGDKSPQVIVALDDYTGTFDLTIYVEHPLADCSFEKSIEVSVAQLSISPDSVCQATSTLFSISGISTAFDSIRWFSSNTYVGTRIGTDTITIPGNFLPSQGNRTIRVVVFYGPTQSCPVSHNIYVIPGVTAPLLTGKNIVCPGDTVEYIVDSKFAKGLGDTVLIDIQDGSLFERIKQSTSIEIIKIIWNTGGGSISIRTKKGNCFSQTVSLHIKDLTELDSVWISGNQMPCSDSEESYIQGFGQKPKNPIWSIDPTFGNILTSDSAKLTVYWKNVTQDTNTYVVFADTICGEWRSDTLPIMIKKRIIPEINLTRVCVETPFVLSINVLNADQYTWYIRDSVIITKLPYLDYEFAEGEEGIYNIGVVWGFTPLCYEGFSWFGKLTVDRKVSPAITAFDDETGEYFNCIVINEPRKISLEATRYNIPGVKYRWKLNGQLWPDSSSVILIIYPEDFSEVPLEISVYAEGALCSDTTKFTIDTCTVPVGCTPIHEFTNFSLEDLGCTSRRITAEIDPDFGYLLEDTVSYPHPKLIGVTVKELANGLWTIRGSTQIYRSVNQDLDLIQDATYRNAGHFLAELVLFSPSIIDSNAICELDTSIWVQVPFTGDFVTDFECHQDSLYKMYLYGILTYLQNFEPEAISYTINGTEYPVIDGDTNFIVSAGSRMKVCINTEMPDESICTFCDSVFAPLKLEAPQIILADTLCRQSLVRFDIDEAEFSDDIIAYTWDFGNNQISRQRNPSYNYGDISGPVTVKLTVRSRWGCEAESTKTIYFKDNTLAGEITLSTGYCQNMAELFLDHNDSGSEPYTYKWNTGDTSSTLITNIDGNYQATLTDGNGCIEILTKNVKLLPVLFNSLEGPDNVCEGEGSFDLTFGGFPEYEYSLFEKSWPSGTSNELSITNSGFNFKSTVNKSGKSGLYKYTLYAFDQSDTTFSTACDSFNLFVQFNPVEILNINDSLLNCKPYTYILNEENGIPGAWYYKPPIGTNIYLGLADSMFVNNGGIYIIGPTTDSDCNRPDTVVIPQAIRLDLFLYGCYDICDTVINKGNVFLPEIYPDRIYTNWSYKHIDGRILKSGSNSSIDSMKLTTDHEGKMYIVAEDDQGCIDSSDLLCLKILECVPPIDCDTIPGVSCPHLSFNRIYLDCDSMRVHYSIYEDMVVPSGWSLCSGIPISIQGAYWIEAPTIVQDTVNLHLYRIRGGILSFHVDSCENAQQISICKDNLVCIKTFAWYFPCFEGECSLPSIFIYQNESTSTIRINAKGELYDLMNCDTSYHYIKAELYGPSCTGLIASAIIANPGVNEEYNINLYFHQDSVRDCYCLKYYLCENSNGTNCEEICVLNPFTGYNQDMRTGGDGDTELNITCAGTQPGSGDNIYGYEGTYSGSVEGAYLDSIIIQNHGSAIQSINVDTNGINGSFILAPSVDSISYHIFILNDTYPNVLIIVGASDVLPSCLHDPTTSRTQADRNISMDIRPNPANQFINIDYSLGKICNTGTLKVSNENGKEQIYTVRINQQGTITLPTVHWPSGSYMISIENCSGQLITKRLIVSH